MALPKGAGRGDIVIAVDFTGDSTFVNWCGARNVSLSIANEIGSTKVGDCEDWSAPAVTSKFYSGQDVTMTVDATWAKSMHLKTFNWAKRQEVHAVRISYPNASVGEIDHIEGGRALLGGFEMGEIGNLDGNLVTENVTLEFDGGLSEPVLKTA